MRGTKSIHEYINSKIDIDPQNPFHPQDKIIGRSFIIDLSDASEQVMRSVPGSINVIKEIYDSREQFITRGFSVHPLHKSAALADRLTSGRVVKPFTFQQEIRCLPAGHTLQVTSLGAPEEFYSSEVMTDSMPRGLPPALVKRIKTGFSVPTCFWLGQSAGVLAWKRKGFLSRRNVCAYSRWAYCGLAASRPRKAMELQ